MSEFDTKEKEFDLSKTSVCIAIPCYSGIVPVETALALTQTVIELKEAGVKVDLVIERENGIITAVRNRLVARYLQESNAEYLFWIDDDIIFTPADFINCLALSTEKKMVGATYPVRKDEPKFFIKYANDEYPEFDQDYGLIKAKGLGLGFMCMHRDIVTEISNQNNTYEDKGLKIADIFKVGRKGNKYWGEDMWFFNDLFVNGHIAYINPLINLKHVGRKDYDYKLLDYMKRKE